MAQAENLVAFQGVAGAHSDMACRKAHPYMDTLPCASFRDVIQAVESGKARLAMIPIENSLAGRVAEFHHLIPDMDLHFVGEYFHRVEHKLLAPKGATLETIETVYSHPQALMQCSEFLHAHNMKPYTYADTAEAAMHVAEWNDPTKAALASTLAGSLYGLELIAENVQDGEGNTTLFMTVTKEPEDLPPVDGSNILTSLIFSTRNIPSALYKAMGGFATNGVNLVKLESYISLTDGGQAEFFITFEGHPEEQRVKLAMEELGFFCRKVKVLGVYEADPNRYKG